MSKNLIENEDYQIVTPAENGLFTVSVFANNAGLLEDFQNVDTIPPISTDVTSCFDEDNLPKIQTLDSLLTNLCELMIRFDGCVKDYQKGDFEHLIKTISNSLIYLYTTNVAINFLGVASLITNPIQDAIDRNNKYPGIYFADTIGNYTHFNLQVTSNDIDQSIVLFIPKIENQSLLYYEKVSYKLSNVGDKTFRHFQNISNEVWYVQHNLNKYPSVVITNINGNVVEGEITYTNKNNLEINFSAPFRGYADLN